MRKASATHHVFNRSVFWLKKWARFTKSYWPHTEQQLYCHILQSWTKLYPPPPPTRTLLPQNQGCENGAFWLLRGFTTGAWFGGHGSLLFHFKLPQNQGCENGAFWLLRGFIMGAWFGGHGGLLFHFILSKIVGWTGCIKLNWRPRLLQTKARGPHVLIRKTPCSNRKWSCSIYMTTDPGDWPHPSGSNIGNNTCTVNCIWRTPSLKGHKTNTHS